MLESLKLRGIEAFLSNPFPFRLVFFLISPLALYVDYIYAGSTLAGFYIILDLLLGFAFWDYRYQALMTLFLTLFRYLFAPTPFPEISVLILTWLSYFLIAVILSKLLKSYVIARKNLHSLTSSLAMALDSRDKYTSFHSQNVARYSEMIAREMGFSERECEHFFIGGLLHDVGKIGVPESILNKPSKLTNQEFEIIKSHTTIGYNILKPVSTFRKNGVLDMVRFHHERYDGLGYPEGLKGEEIPLAARIMAVADTFDALTTKRIYRNEFDLEETINEISKNKGAQFDSEVAEAFLSILQKKGTDIFIGRNKHL